MKRNQPSDHTTELKRLHLLTLSSEKLKEKNSSARVLGSWYGARLRLLINFYHKSEKEIGFLCKVDNQVISWWVNNVEKPNFKQLNQLAFLFEVPVQYFTENEVTITLKEQITINYETSTTQESEKTAGGEEPQRFNSNNKTW